MKVMFVKTYFGPNNVRYRKNIWHDVPDDWREILPTGAKIDESPPEPERVITTRGAPATRATPVARGRVSPKEDDDD